MFIQINVNSELNVDRNLLLQDESTFIITFPSVLIKVDASYSIYRCNGYVNHLRRDIKSLQLFKMRIYNTDLKLNIHIRGHI
jgi:hypothetical protein